MVFLSTQSKTKGGWNLEHGDAGGLLGIHMLIYETHIKFMFVSNYAAGKTEVNLRLVGPEAKKVKQRVIDWNHTIPCQSKHGEFLMRVVGNYKHLGKLTNEQGDQILEINARKQSCNQFRAYCGQMLRQ